MSTIKIKDADVADKYYNVIEAGTLAEPHEPVIPPYEVTYAIQQIFSDDAVTVSVQEKAKSLIKFGENLDIDAGVSETVWATGGNETYQTTNAIDTIVSDNAGDTQDVIIEGHTISGSDLTFSSQTATLNGTTNVTLSTPLARVTRLENNDSTDFAGTVTVFENGGTTHLTSIGNGSQKCSTSLSSVDYWIITQLTFSVRRSNTAKVDFELQIKKSGKTFLTKFGGEASDTTGTIVVKFDQPIIAPPNSDVRMIATSNAANTEVEASIHGYLAIIT